MQGVGVLIGEDEPIPDLIVGTGEVALDDRGIPAAQIELAVEVVSRSTAAMDRRIKPDIYAEAGIPNYWRLETSRFKGQLPGEELPVLFAYALADTGEYELVQRVSAGTKAVLKRPCEVVIDPATLH